MKNITTILLLFYVSISSAQVDDKTNKITVNGHAEQEIVATSYVIEIVLSETIMNTNYGRQIIDMSIDSVEKLLFEKITNAGYDIKKLKPINVYSNNYSQPFVINISYEYPVSKISDIRKFFKEVRFNYISMMRIRKIFDIDTNELENKLSIEALKDSKIKAEKLLTSAGMTLGKIVSISVSYGRIPLVDNSNQNGSFDFSGKQLQSKDIMVTYEIQ